MRVCGGVTKMKSIRQVRGVPSSRNQARSEGHEHGAARRRWREGWAADTKQQRGAMARRQKKNQAPGWMQLADDSRAETDAGSARSAASTVGNAAVCGSKSQPRGGHAASDERNRAGGLERGEAQLFSNRAAPVARTFGEDVSRRASKVCPCASVFATKRGAVKIRNDETEPCAKK